VSNIYFYTAVGAFFTGVFIASFISISIFLIYFLLLLSLLIALHWRFVPKQDSSMYSILIVLVLTLCAIGMARMYFDTLPYNHSVLADDVGREITIEGLVVDEPDRRERSMRVVINVGNDTLLLILDRYDEVAYGDFVRVTGLLRVPEPFEGDYGRVFHYDGYLRVRGIGYTMSYPQTFVVMSSRNGNKFLHLLFDFKNTFITAINRTIPDPAAGLGIGLLLGVKQALGDNLEDSFRRTGLIHIVVLSGFNVMIVITAVMFLLGSVLPLYPRIGIGLIAIIAFALLVGLSATVVRATIMASLVLIAQFVGRKYDVVRALFVAGAIMVVVQPHILAFDIGFQLSFMATLGLILVAPQFETLMGYVPSQFGVREFLLATIATQIAVLPLLIFHIGEVSIIAIVANVLVLPWVALAMALTFLTGIIALAVPSLVLPLAMSAYTVLWVMIFIVEWCASIPYAAITLPPVPWYVVFIMYSVLGICCYKWHRYIVGSAIKYQSHLNQGTVSTSQNEQPISLLDWEVVDENEYKKSL
jgi:competence protein ComEC